MSRRSDAAPDRRRATGRRRPPVEKALATARLGLHLPDPSPIYANAAVAATAQLEGDPLWLMNVGGSGTGKTEIERALGDVVDEPMSEFTVPGLLSWAGGPERGRPVGLLARHMNDAKLLIAIYDMSPLLSLADRNRRSEELSLLRTLWDGL